MLSHMSRLAAASLLWVGLAACGALPEDAALAHRGAYQAEREAVSALRQLDDGVSLSELQELRPRYEEAMATAQRLRQELQSKLQREHGRRWLGKTAVAEVLALNDDLIRCHETLGERAAEAFRYMEDGRARRGFRHDVWGYIDPRDCFDELSPIVEGYLQ